MTIKCDMGTYGIGSCFRFCGLRVECRRRFLEVDENSGGGVALKNDGRRGSGGAWVGEGTDKLSAVPEEELAHSLWGCEQAVELSSILREGGRFSW